MSAMNETTTAMIAEQQCQMNNSRAVQDISWIISCALLVITMQGGFALLEAGSIRSLNACNIMFKNLADLAFGGLAWWLLGYGLSYGKSYDAEGIAIFTFAATASTIDSGCVVERMKFGLYVFLSFYMTALIYPLAAHWVWDSSGWLFKMGYIDLAGTTVVHMLGGTSGLVCSLCLGPRLGVHGRKMKFPMKDSHILDDATVELCRRVFTPNPVNALFGTLLLWFAWFAFNAGSTMSMTGNATLLAGRILFTTTLASCAGGCTGFLFSAAHHGQITVEALTSSILGSLVGITGCCHTVTASGAVIIGVASALLALGTANLSERYGIDDPVGVLPVHLVNGIFGGIAGGLFTAHDVPCTEAPAKLGLFYGGGVELLQIQLVGILAILAWSALGTGMFFSTLKLARIDPRIPEIAELIGLDVVEHGCNHFDALVAMRKLHDLDYFTAEKIGRYMKAAHLSGGDWNSKRKISGIQTTKLTPAPFDKSEKQLAGEDAADPVKLKQKSLAE